MTIESRNKMQMEALERATTVRSLANYQTVIEEFAARGIDPENIDPQVNVLTYNAWQAKGRQVRKGEKSVCIMVWIPCKGAKDSATSTPTDEQKTSGRMFPKKAYVFHESQTDAKQAN